MQPALGQQVCDLADPEHRHRDADEAECHQDAVERPAAEGRCQRADEDAARDPQHGRAEDERERDGHGFRDGRNHKLAAVDEAREVAGDEQTLHQERVLDGERLVEAELVAHLRQDLGRGVLAGDARRRVGAGCGEEDQEHQHADAEHHEGHLRQAAQECGEH